jgi:hypothetical protein
MSGRVNMRKLLVTVCAIGLLLSSALAQEETSKEEQARKEMLEGLRRTEATRHVPSGTNRILWFAATLNPDCSSAGDTEIRVTKQPGHGMVEIRAGEGFVYYARDAIRFKCNTKKVRGLNVNYKSSTGYRGADDFEIHTLSPNGFLWEMRFNINVH